ncbi:MAG: MoaD/ThiS family protein [Woeseiaceae bacterium]|jgi:molybdopterin converting factor small subunit|nr:MoaD/ThiS family protein [Woeseiaceae bacterium]MDE1010227.1 MoaD/ThiS family protein [Paraburkholderia fungorum]
MPDVELFAGLRDAVAGAKSVQVEGTTIRELLQNIAREYPSLHKRIEQGIAVAIDGNIYRDDWDQQISEGAEVVLLSRIAGG